MNPDDFLASAGLRDIVRNDARVGNYRDGDIVIRAGDHMNSCFVVLAGKVRVIVEPQLDDALLGRRQSRKKSFARAFSQLWGNARNSEVRDIRRYLGDTSIGLRRTSSDEARVFLQDVPSILGKHQTVQLGAGDMFGEIATIARMPRTTSIFAEGQAELLEVRWQGIRDIRQRSASFRDHIEALYRDRSLKVHLRESGMFSHLDEEALQEVAVQTLFETYGDIEWFKTYKKLVGRAPEERLQDEPIIAGEDQYPDGLIMVRAGFARVTERVDHGNRTVRTLTHRDVFGLDEIAHNWRTGAQASLQHTMRALGYCDILRVPTTIIEELVLPRLPEDKMPPPLAERSGRRSAWRGREAEDEIDGGLFEFFVDHRYINGTATMIIDNDRCVRCDDCVRACSDAHDGNPRFVRHGAHYGRYMVANACMHCADPVCMLGCPTGAIHRDPAKGVVVINDDTCIGCSTCANSCPYDNIRMVQIRDGKGAFIRDETTHAPLAKATKCDLCSDQLGGPACQRACPHDALIRVDMQDQKRLADWLAH